MVCCMSRPRDNYSRFNRPPAEQSPASGGTLSFSIGMARRSRKKSSNTSALRASASDVDMRQVLAGVLLIAGAVLVIYWPSLRGDFVLDDEILVSQNNLVRASDGLTRFWFSTEPADYWPMTNSSFWLEWRLWLDNPTGYRATNIALHIADALLVWLVLRRLAIPGAFFAALLFAVHPVNVESVAWIAQRKNVLSLLFFLLSAYAYLRAELSGELSAGG